MSVRLWTVGRVVRDAIINVGIILKDESDTAAFLYLPAYVRDPRAIELSCSLPLISDTFPEVRFRPYFEGLLPEGAPLRRIAERNGVREEDYLSLLGLVGRECIGDVVIYEHDFEDGRDPNIQDEEFRVHVRDARYEPVTLDEVAGMLKDLDSVAETTSRSRLSLAGSQRKIALAHNPGEPMDRAWFQPIDFAASTHILKVGTTPRYASLELVCMGAAPELGIETAKTTGLWLSQPVVVSERFDREIVKATSASDEPPIVYRLHQEDLNQAFGFTPGSKYAEIEGGSYRAVAHLLRERSLAVAEDLEQLARIAAYNYLVGNCDNHLKNLSILHASPREIRLAPAYDILCTTIFEEAPGVPRFSRRMGMRLGSATEIDDVTADDFGLLAKDLGIGRRMMVRLCTEIAENAVDALMAAGEHFAYVSDEVPYDAEDLINEMEPRLDVLGSVR